MNSESPLLLSQRNPLIQLLTPQFTLRAVVAGLGVGILSLTANTYFGLQTGMMGINDEVINCHPLCSSVSLPSGLISFSIFKAFEKKLDTPYSKLENVLSQTIAVAVGTMPLAAGLVGIIPAFEKFLLPEEGGPWIFSTWELIVWSFGVAFFGVFFAIHLRHQVIVKEKLRFPSGKATAMMIQVLHQGPEVNLPSATLGHEDKLWRQKVNCLIYSFVASAAYISFSYFFPIIRNLPIFGSYLAQQWLFDFQPSPAYIGQGIIMHLPTTLSMLFGCFIGWGILSPLAKSQGWAPGPVDDWQSGSKGWILWASLSIMSADSIVSLAVLLVQNLRSKYPGNQYKEIGEEIEQFDDNPQTHDDTIGVSFTVVGILASSVICVIATKFVFGDVVPVYTIIFAIVIAAFLSMLAVRALVFMFVVPRSNPNAVIINLVAGAIAEAGAQQSGDLMQDLKTGYLLSASLTAQFHGQLIGSLFGVILAPLIYRLYTRIYTIPSSLFQIPTAHVWIDCSRLVTGQGLPPYVQPTCLVLAIIFGGISCLKAMSKHPWVPYLPSGLATAIGMYNVPSFTFARLIGGMLSWYWLRRCRKRNKDADEILMIIVASGLVLGEGVFSIINLLLAAFGVPHL
ncbi:putative oligopeptide transporter [Neolecta irregularis DAH-3]|uniref:Putative oligopeptide transporter n=1 Tax=Neolecta irregularis (strain DAH-3) TaxID=1198029 RepID=A0A1U7LN56_NEOID|nr:putative oligopeptide transporter [Neolecta irregularis DAH-3]|eukprot:OLL24058.1 putative oligopeptide transporter [Neolecta irregularis DAH-3]